MSFLTEYFDEYRAHPIKKVQMCVPEKRWLEIEGQWRDPKSEKGREWTDEETNEFIRKTMHSIRSQSTYFRDYCDHLDQSFKTRKFKPRPHPKCYFKSAGQSERVKFGDEGDDAPSAKLQLKDTEVMKMAEELYNRDLDSPTLKPLGTQGRILGYVRRSLYHTGLTEYQAQISRLAYELVRDARIPKYVASNNGRPRWGYPPEGVRQPPLDGAPFEGERLY